MTEQHCNRSAAHDTSATHESIMVGEMTTGHAAPTHVPDHDDSTHESTQLDAVFAMTARDFVRAELDVTSSHRGGLAWAAAEIVFPESRVDFDLFRVRIVEEIVDPSLTLVIDESIRSLGYDPEMAPGKQGYNMQFAEMVARAAEFTRDVFLNMLRETVTSLGVPDMSPVPKRTSKGAVKKAAQRIRQGRAA